MARWSDAAYLPAMTLLEQHRAKRAESLAHIAALEGPHLHLTSEAATEARLDWLRRDVPDVDGVD